MPEPAPRPTHLGRRGLQRLDHTTQATHHDLPATYSNRKVSLHRGVAGPTHMLRIKCRTIQGSSPLPLPSPRPMTPPGLILQACLRCRHLSVGVDGMRRTLTSAVSSHVAYSPHLIVLCMQGTWHVALSYGCESHMLSTASRSQSVSRRQVTSQPQTGYSHSMHSREYVRANSKNKLQCRRGFGNSYPHLL